MAEFVEGFDKLASISPSVSLFGSPRTAAERADYALALDIAQRLSNAGFSVVSGGGPGITEAINKGAYAGKSLSVGLDVMLSHEQETNELRDVSLSFRHLFARKVMFLKFASAYVVLPGASELWMSWQRCSPWYKPARPGASRSFWSAKHSGKGWSNGSTRRW